MKLSHFTEGPGKRDWPKGLAEEPGWHVVRGPEDHAVGVSCADGVNHQFRVFAHTGYVADLPLCQTRGDGTVLAKARFVPVGPTVIGKDRCARCEAILVEVLAPRLELSR